MTETPAYPKWHWMITVLCVASGALWAYFIMRAYAVQPYNNFLSPTGPARKAMFDIAWLGTLVPEAAHQAVRLAIWFGRCGAAALRARAPDRQRSRTWLARFPLPYRWQFWQAT